MSTFLATLLLFGAAIGAMSIGVVLSGKRLKGSCGGTGQGCGCSAERRARCALVKDEATG